MTEAVRVRACGRIPPTTPGALCTHCKKRPQSSLQRAKADVPAERYSWCGPCRGWARAHEERRAYWEASAPRREGQTHCACGRRFTAAYPKAGCRPCVLLGITEPANDNALGATRAA